MFSRFFRFYFTFLQPGQSISGWHDCTRASHPFATPMICKLLQSFAWLLDARKVTFGCWPNEAVFLQFIGKINDFQTLRW